MKILLTFIILIFSVLNSYADNFWLNPKWGTSLNELKSKYTFDELRFLPLDKNLANFFNKDVATKFKQYVINNKEYYNYGNEKFFVVAGFYNNNLQYIMIATEEIPKTKEKENELSSIYLKKLKIDGLIKMWSIGFTLLSGYSMVGYGNNNNTYCEVQIPHGKRYLQFTCYMFNKIFFKNLKTKKGIQKPSLNEYIFTRKL